MLGGRPNFKRTFDVVAFWGPLTIFSCFQSIDGVDTELLLDLQRCFYDSKLWTQPRYPLRAFLGCLIVYGSCLFQIIAGAFGSIIVFFTCSKFCTQQLHIAEIKEEIQGFVHNDGLKEHLDKYNEEWSSLTENHLVRFNDIQKNLEDHEGRLEILNQITNQLTLDFCAQKGRGFMIIAGDPGASTTSHEIARERATSNKAPETKPVKIKIKDRASRNFSFDISDQNGRAAWQNFVQNIKSYKQPVAATKPLRYCEIQKYNENQVKYKRLFVPGRGWVGTYKFEQEESIYGAGAVIEHVNKYGEQS